MTIPDFICYRRNNLIQLLEHRKAKRKWQWQWRFAGFDLLSTNLFVLFSVAPVSVTWFRFLFFLSYTLFGLRIGSFSCDAPFFFFCSHLCQVKLSTRKRKWCHRKLIISFLLFLWLFNFISRLLFMVFGFCFLYSGQNNWTLHWRLLIPRLLTSSN